MALVTGIVLVAGARACFWSDRRLIRNLLEEAAAEASITGRETPIERMAGAARVARFFTEDAMIRLDQGASMVGGRNAIMGLAAQMRSASGPLRVSVQDVQITLNRPATATARLTVIVSGADLGGRVTAAREVSVALRKESGAWLIGGVETVSALQRPK